MVRLCSGQELNRMSTKTKPLKLFFEQNKAPSECGIGYKSLGLGANWTKHWESIHKQVEIAALPRCHPLVESFVTQSPSLRVCESAFRQTLLAFLALLTSAGSTGITF